MAKTISQLIANVKAQKPRSAWQKGVQKYAVDLLDDVAGNYYYGNRGAVITSYNDLKRKMLNGAKDWRQFSEGGCSLIYNGDIAERLCSPSELKKVRYGEYNPNSRENWLDVQARALYQADLLIRKLF